MARPAERTRTLQDEMSYIHSALRRQFPSVERVAALVSHAPAATELLARFTDPLDTGTSREGYSLDL